MPLFRSKTAILQGRPLSQRAWIEICIHGAGNRVSDRRRPLSQRAWIEMRNLLYIEDADLSRPLSQRAWIEMITAVGAAHMEDCRPLSQRAWIEMSISVPTAVVICVALFRRGRG